MTVLDRLRRWLAGLFGRQRSQTSSETDEDTGATDGLDPDNVTEARTEATDDSVAKLETIKQRRTDDESGDGSTASRRDP
jgi:hypothetical protein